jgi:hypothetical protein
VALLRRLVAQGLSGAQISQRLDCTKNQVVGKCRRLGIRLQGNNYGGGWRDDTVRQKSGPAPVPVVRKRKPVVAPVVVVPALAPPPPASECKWLNGSGPPWLYCGGCVRPGTSWCEPHYRRVYGLRAERVA